MRNRMVGRTVITTLVVFLIGFCILYTVFRSNVNLANTQWKPTIGATFVYTRTPNPSDVAIWQLTPHTMIPKPPTSTVLPISKITDLSPDLPDEEKYMVTVAHPEGTYEAFKVGPVIPWYFRDHKDPPDALIMKMKLHPEDKIIDWYDIGYYKAMRNRPPTETPLPTTPSLPTNAPSWPYEPPHSRTGYPL